MDFYLRFLVLSTSVLVALGGYPGYFGYHQPLVAPVYYHHPQPAFRYHTTITNNHLPTAVVPAVLPWERHFYSTPTNTYRGFAYHTQYVDGANSQVVFVTGPESQKLMQQSFEEFRKLTNIPSIASLARTKVPSSAQPALSHPSIFATFYNSLSAATTTTLAPDAEPTTEANVSPDDEKTADSNNVEVDSAPPLILSRIIVEDVSTTTSTTQEPTTAVTSTTAAATTTTAAATTSTAAASTEAATEEAVTEQNDVTSDATEEAPSATEQPEEDAETTTTI